MQLTFPFHSKESLTGTAIINSNQELLFFSMSNMNALKEK